MGDTREIKSPTTVGTKTMANNSSPMTIQNDKEAGKSGPTKSEDKKEGGKSRPMTMREKLEAAEGKRDDYIGSSGTSSFVTQLMSASPAMLLGQSGTLYPSRPPSVSGSVHEESLPGTPTPSSANQDSGFDWDEMPGEIAGIAPPPPRPKPKVPAPTEQKKMSTSVSVPLLTVTHAAIIEYPDKPTLVKAESSNLLCVDYPGQIDRTFMGKARLSKAKSESAPSLQRQKAIDGDDQSKDQLRKQLKDQLKGQLKDQRVDQREDQSKDQNDVTRDQNDVTMSDKDSRVTSQTNIGSRQNSASSLATADLSDGLSDDMELSIAGSDEITGNDDVITGSGDDVITDEQVRHQRVQRDNSSSGLVIDNALSSHTHSVETIRSSHSTHTLDVKDDGAKQTVKHGKEMLVVSSSSSRVLPSCWNTPVNMVYKEMDMQ